MVDGLYSIKEASELLDCSKQNIYGRKEQLIKQGLMEQSETGTYYLNEKGINYLRERRIETIKSSSQDLNQVDSQVLNKDKTPVFSIDNTEYINLLKEQIQDLKNDRDYWKNEYTKKDSELKEKNEYIQGVNTKVFALLNTEEGNRKQEESVKKGFWGWIKGNNSRH